MVVRCVVEETNVVWTGRSNIFSETFTALAPSKGLKPHANKQKKSSGVRLPIFTVS